MWGSKEVEVRGSKIWAVVDGEEESILVLWLLPVFSKVCMVVLCSLEGVFHKLFVRPKFPEKLLQTVKGLHVQIWVNGLTIWHNVYQNHPICIPKMSCHDFHCSRGSLKLLLRSRMMPLKSLSFCRRLKLMHLCFILSEYAWQQSFAIDPRMGMNIWTQVSPHGFVLVSQASRNQTRTGISTVVHTSLGHRVLSCKLSGCNLSVISGEFIRTLKQLRCDCCYWPARETCVTELPLIFLRTCISWSPTTNSAFINIIDTLYIFNRSCIFVTGTFSGTKNSMTARCLKPKSPYQTILTTPAHAREALLFRGAAVAGWDT
jgi:hypothetical protein